MPRRNLKKHKPGFFSFNKLLFSSGILLIIFSLSLDIYQKSLPVFLNYSSPQDYTESENLTQNTPKVLLIPEISLNLEIEESMVKGKFWEISEKGVSHLNSSAKIGESANLVLYGHNREKLLKRLPEISQGDQIFLTSSDGKVYKYTVEQTQIVKPIDVWILDKGTSESLTIYTCTGFLDSERFVITAKPSNG